MWFTLSVLGRDTAHLLGGGLLVGANTIYSASVCLLAHIAILKMKRIYMVAVKIEARKLFFLKQNAVKFDTGFRPRDTTFCVDMALEIDILMFLTK